MELLQGDKMFTIRKHHLANDGQRVQGGVQGEQELKDH